jgi:hypothetical protein
MREKATRLLSRLRSQVGSGFRLLLSRESRAESRCCGVQLRGVRAQRSGGGGSGLRVARRDRD